MEVVRKEFQQQKDSAVLTNFMSNNGSLLDTIVKDSKTAQVEMNLVPRYIEITMNLKSEELDQLCLSLYRRCITQWWSISERIPNPHLLLCFSLFSPGSLKHIR